MEIEQVNKKAGPILVFPKFTQIKCTANPNLVSLLSTEGTVHQIMLGKNQAAECRQIRKLTNIKKIESCGNHFLALQKNVIPPIKEWTSKQVAKFISDTGFGECAQIAIYNNISGDKIAEFDEDIWIETFGIEGDNEL